MKKQILIIVSFLLITISFTSCNDDTTEEQPTKTELLTSGKWQGETQKVYTDNTLTNTIDINNQDLELFINHEFKAYTDNVVDTEGNWLLSSDETTITLFGGANYTVNELTSSKFVFTLHTNIGNNETEVKYSYKK